MIAQISEYSMIGKYLIVGFCTLILNSIIDRWYVETDNLSCLSLLLLLYILKTNKKKFYKGFWYHKSRMNYGIKIMKTT